jgi:hypothetical protein
MNDAKIQFSPAEMELMNNSALILTKNKVLLKVKTMLEGLQEELVHTVYQQPDFSSHPIFQESPKISKGENYLGLPYLVLDYPRMFDSLNILQSVPCSGGAIFLALPFMLQVHTKMI